MVLTAGVEIGTIAPGMNLPHDPGNAPITGRQSPKEDRAPASQLGPFF